MSSDWSRRASLYDGPRAVGGRLVVTGDRLSFVPHALDRALAGRSLDVALDDVVRLSLTPRTWFAPRRHVLVETGQGVRARLLVNGAREVLARLADAAKDVGAQPTVET